jgi:murein DD-endopeptidase MepM/ murein hydrolase activator NlpD
VSHLNNSNPSVSRRQSRPSPRFWTWLSQRLGHRAKLVRFIALVSLSLCCWLGVSAWSQVGQNPAVAAGSANPSLQELQQWRRTLKDYRSGVRQQRQQLQQLEWAARDRLQGLQQNVQMTELQIKQARENLRQAQASLVTLEAEFAVSQQKYQERLDSTVARLRFLQRRRPENAWAMLLDSQNLDQFLDRRQQLQRVYQADQTLLRNLKADTDRIKAQKGQIEFQVAEINQLQDQLQQQQVAFIDQAQQQQVVVNQLTQDRQAMQAAEVQLQQDSDNISAMIRQRVAYLPPQRPGDIVIEGNGSLSFPVRAPITSHFGWRTHPVLGTRRLHAGTDFGADTGTPIRAAGAGRVIYAGWQGGYGNTVIIDHGQGMTTLYGHCSQIYASDGQTVQQGEAVAAVGSTGMSTGPHLHFEVRVGGEPQNPLAYLGGYA